MEKINLKNLTGNTIEKEFDKLSLDYLEFKCEDENSCDKIIDWYCNCVSILRESLTIHKFYSKNLKRNSSIFDIYKFGIKANNSVVGYTVKFIGVSCRSLFSELPSLYKEMENCENFELKRLDLKFIEECNLNQGELVEEHQKFLHQISKGKVFDRIKTESTGITTYFKFSEGEVRLYNYFGDLKTNLEFEFTRKKFLDEISLLLKENKLVEVKEKFLKKILVESLTFPLKTNLIKLFDHFEENYTLENVKEKPAEIYHLNMSLLCAKENSLSSISEESPDDILEVKKTSTIPLSEDQLEPFFGKDECLVLWFLYDLYKKQNSATLHFDLQDMANYFNLGSSRRIKTRLKENLLSLFDYSFAQGDEKSKTLSRFISKLKILNGTELFVTIDTELFRKTELEHTPLNTEVLKGYWDKLKLDKGLLSLQDIQQSFMIHMSLGSFSETFPFSYNRHKDRKQIFLNQIKSQLPFLKNENIIQSYNFVFSYKSFKICIDHIYRSKTVELLFHQKGQ